jgi:hypothetical protein
MKMRHIADMLGAAPIEGRDMTDGSKGPKKGLRKNVLIVSALLLSSLAAGCADTGAPGAHIAANVDLNDGFYDGFYGPFYDGHWDDAGHFWYADQDHNWHRDDGIHFAHSARTGFSHVHGGGARR